MTRRASRTLIGVLSITTVVGLSAYAIAHRAPKSHAKQTSTTPSKASPVSLMALTNTPAATQPAEKSSKPVPETAKDTATKPPTADKGDAQTLADAKPSGSLVRNASYIKGADAPSASAKGAIADGKAKIDGGDLLGGRKVLNDALLAGQLSEADATTAKQLISDANKSIVFSTKRFTDDTWQSTHTVASGEVLAKIAFKYSLTPDLLLRINGIPDARRLRAGANIKVLQGPFHVVVTKHAFTMDVYLGSPGEKGAQYVMTYPVGLGRDDSTPTGTWMVEQRIPNPKYYSPRGEGVIEAGDPKNPLGKFWLALTGTDGNAVGKQSYGIHGTIEPDSIGKQSSMGCIRMRNEDVAVVYELLVSGKSTVVVKD